MSNLTGRPPLGQKPSKPERGTHAAKAHMARVAAMPCIICHKPGPSAVHHCISGRYGQHKASDFDTLPLCWNCHQGPNGIHASKRDWEALHGFDTDYLPIVAAMLEPLP